MAVVDAGGVEDAYAVDCDIKDQPATSWAVCIAQRYVWLCLRGPHLAQLVFCSSAIVNHDLVNLQGSILLRNPRHNKGLSFTEKEQDGHCLRGLLPPVVLPEELQETWLVQNVPMDLEVSSLSLSSAMSASSAEVNLACMSYFIIGVN